MAYTIAAIAILFFTGHALKWLFIKTKIPDLLFLILIGLLLGPIFGVLKADDFGKVGSVITTLALIVILYDGGLNLKAKDLANSSLPAALLSLLGAASIGIIGFVLAYVVAGQEWHISLLFGLGIGSTSSAVVIPMVKFLSVSDKAKTILSLESAFTDVLAIVTFLVITDGVLAGNFSIKDIIIGIGPKTLSAVLAGIGFGLAWAFLRRRFSFLTTMTFASEAWALFAFGMTEVIGLNGAMSVLALGFTLTNLNLLPDWLKEVLSKEPVSAAEISLLSELSFLLKTVFFIYLGILIQFSDPLMVFFSFLITLFIFITRFLCVRLVYKKDQYTKLDTMVTVAMGPRGLAAAVLASIPLQRGIEGGEFIQNAIFGVIPFSIILTAVFVMLSEKEEFREKMKVFFKGYQ